MCGFAVDGRGLRHFLVEDREYRDILQQAGAELVEERDVLVVPVDPRPGWLANFTSRLGEAGVNIEVIYMAVDNHLAVVPNRHRQGSGRARKLTQVMPEAAHIIGS